MYVGVILADSIRDKIGTSIPHVCGGDPYKTNERYSQRKVFPMYVGVILNQ